MAPGASKKVIVFISQLVSRRWLAPVGINNVGAARRAIHGT